MKKIVLIYYFLLRLNLANHDGVTAQIDDAVAAFETENPILIQARTALHTARLEEDDIYHRYSAKDFTSDDLKNEKHDLCKTATTIRGSMKALTHLPDSQAEMRRVGELAFQKFADFNFSTSDGCEACARKIINMKQEWTTQQEALTTLGIWQWITLAGQQAITVLNLIEQRVLHEAAKEKGAMQAARKKTDAAVKDLYEVINSMNTMMPSDALTELTRHLHSIEERAKLYYISSPSGDEPEPTPTPDPEPDPEP